MQSDLCQTFHINHQDFCSKKIVATFFVYGNNTNNYLHHSQPQKSPKTTEANRKKIIKFQPCPAPPPYLHTSPHKIYSIRYIQCSFKFILEVGVEDSISCLNLTSLLAFFVFLLCRLTNGAFTIESSAPTLRINLNEHPIF
jgi:hypothetical protein